MATATADRAEVRVQLEQLPAAVVRLVIAAALSHGSFRDLIGARLTVTPVSGEPLAVELTEAEDEQALIFAELYRHSTGRTPRSSNVIMRSATTMSASCSGSSAATSS
ncbi:MAG: TerD family protein [Thermochromatium sp.]